MTSFAEDRRRRVPWGLVLVLTGALAISLTSYRYLVPGAPAASPGVMANRFTPYGVLTVHAGFAATALAIGPVQFLPRLRLRRPALHRWVGRAYVLCSLVGGAAGLLLAFGTTAGPAAGAGFGLLAIIWLAVTTLAWRKAVARRFAEHRRWMIRSYALTFAAVTLRVYLPIAAVLPVAFVESYRAISFLCWVPNLAFAEWRLRRT